ncbi:hypothetical protein TrCOL_g4351 [Triparma columacea]|uniref:EXS domain-containing protein n=1 Tax=Triparma columacea TaxID=722753 RepID=A0A9W7G9J9_9STRA|nr:hypothetical protein TrCOL_g4351 [Triparma columacea]
MSEVANIWSTDQTDVTPTSALLRSPTVIILFIGLWGVNIAILDRFGLSYKRAFGFLKGKTNAGNSTGRIAVHDNNSNDDKGVEMTQTIKSDNIKNKMRALSHAQSALDALSHLEIGNSNDEEDQDNLPLLSPSPSSSSPTSVPPPSITSDITLVSVGLLVLLYLTQLTWITLFSGGVLGASLMFYAYTFVVILSSPPNTITGRMRVKLRVFITILWEIVCGARDFVHVFVADALCSLSKVFFDQGLLLTLAFHYPDHIARSSKSLIIPPLFASSPYLIRARQCANSWINFENKSDPMRHMHVLNGVKYLSSIVPIVLLTMEQVEGDEIKRQVIENRVILALVINTVYTFCWDTFVDWGLGTNLLSGFNFCEVGPGSASHVDKENKGRDGCIRQGIRFGNKATTLAIIVNLSLRCAWALRFSALSLTEDQFILLAQFLEVFRRALWNVFRIEWQLVTMRNNCS